MPARRVLVSGIVQGVGFRPFIWRLANELRLCGWVRNAVFGVEIHIEGEEASLEQFLRQIPRDAPAIARIDQVENKSAAPLGVTDFTILLTEPANKAENEKNTTAISPDLGICPDCLVELFDPASPRYRYPLIACTRCGPRYSVIRNLPYCREVTSLAPYPLCRQCATEYTDPLDRRFHAETTACPICGPRHHLLNTATGKIIDSVDGDAAATAWARIQAGGIVAVKGLGGFHLVCDATNPEAVANLRHRKSRDAKPFATMVANRASLAQWVECDEVSLRILESEARPIALLPRKQDAPSPLNGVAPNLARLGIMFPATPMQWLIFHEALGRPEGTAWTNDAQPAILVMTSANIGGEPILHNDETACSRLSDIADLIWLHGREIITPGDDSLLIPSSPSVSFPNESPIFIRRGRGYTPKAIFFHDDAPDVLALGGLLKNTFCVTRGREAFLSQHIGSLDNVATIHFLEQTLAHLNHVFAPRPAAIAHDLHPDFPSTGIALELSARLGIPALPIAHHHAHIAAVCAEWQIPADYPIIGLALDGFGLGTDGTLWGGELLRVEGASCLRLGHLAPLRLPGGDAAAREPWRVALALLHQNGETARIESWLCRHFPERSAAPLLAMLEKGLNTPSTTSMGRVFDAAAALLGITSNNHYEAEAAMRLESLALSSPLPITSFSPFSSNTIPPPETVYRLRGSELDLSPLLLSLLEESDMTKGAARFHQGLHLALAAWVAAVADAEKIKEIALSGGCLQNALLACQLSAKLKEAGLIPLLPQAIPPGDGGLALGQAWIAREMVKAAC